MTLEAFALASRASIEVADDAALMRKAAMAARVSDALLVRGDAGTRRLIRGAGRCRDRWMFFPTVLADRSFTGSDSDELVPVNDVPFVREVLGSVMGGWSEDLDKEMHVLFVAQGVRYAAPGSELLGVMAGRVGPHVHWGAGRQGFLTAGHVAPSAGTGVTDDNGTPLGTVLWSNDPALSPSANPDIDAALVAFDPAYSAATGRSPIIAGVGDMLTVASTGQQAEVLGYFAHLRLGGAQACYAECYATEMKITQPGDSGALVEARGDVVGMVTGGFVRRDMTVVQAIGYQLSEIRRRSGHMLSL